MNNVSNSAICYVLLFCVKEDQIKLGPGKYLSIIVSQGSLRAFYDHGLISGCGSTVRVFHNCTIFLSRFRFLGRKNFDWECLRSKYQKSGPTKNETTSGRRKGASSFTLMQRVSAIKWKMIRLVEHIASSGKIRNAYAIFIKKNLKQRNYVRCLRFM